MRSSRGAGRAGELLPLRLRMAVDLGGGLLTNLLRTARFEVIHGREHYEATRASERGVVYVLWHGRLLPSSYFHRRDGLATLISQHRDGDYIARVVQTWGFSIIRGSSSRGGTAALREIVRVLRQGTGVALTPDGPRGPRQVMKRGPVLAAQLAGVPIVPVSAGADRAWWFGGWDRFMVPKPLSRICVAYGAPIEVPRGTDEGELNRIVEATETELNRLTEWVDTVAAG